MNSGDNLPMIFNSDPEFEALKELLSETEEMLHFGTWSYDIVSGAMQWSNGKYALLNFTPSELEGRLTLDFFLHLIHANDREGFITRLNRSVSDGSEFEYTYTLHRKEEDDIAVVTKAKVVRDKHGNPAKLAGVTKDITRERDYEQSLEEKVKELDRSNKELEDFAYIASHDLQEPLRKITSFSERLKERIGNDIGPENQFYLNRMLAATDNMRALIDNLLEFSRTSRYSQAFEKTDFNVILSEVIADLELKIEETNAIIESETLPVLKAIPMQIRQLFTNLITNAIKFRSPNGPPIIKITSHSLSKEEKDLYKLRHSKNWRLISIADKGIGFEQEYAVKIFQIFQRLHGKSEYPGTGIGLAICKKIVENHKGIIFAEGKPDLGAEFTFILPEQKSDAHE